MSVFLSTLLSNAQKLDGGAMFGNAPKAMWEQWIEPDDLNRIDLATRCLLVEGPGYRLLCETGIGAFFDPKLAERYGVQNPEQHMLLDGLQKHGLEPNDIDFVILSHLHFDHAGGILKTYDPHHPNKIELAFPKSKIVVGREALARALNPHPRDRASFISELPKVLEASGNLIIVNQAHHAELPDEVSFIFSHGHTPGQMLTQIRGTRQQVCYCGDLIPGTPWIHAPITMGYDRYPELLIDEKIKLNQSAAQNQWLYVFTHDTRYAAATVAELKPGRFSADQTFGELRRYEI